VNAALNAIFQIVDAALYATIILVLVVLCAIWLNVFVVQDAKLILVDVVLIAIL